ncbi:MAG: oxidoreductase [Rhodoferax sp.]|nr:oxidoreductase [Rhodoferax sp.]
MSAPIHTTLKPGTPIRLALIGFGNAGRIFHAPLIASVPGLELACIVSSQPQAVAAAWPGVRCAPQAQQAFDDPAVDAVVVATDNASHHGLARAALLAGKHVVVDKPCTPTLAETEDLLALAARQQRLLTVFQNRRLDGDFLSLQALLADGTLGRVTHVLSHFDRWRPTVPGRWRDQPVAGAGLWLDLGAHLVDQAVQLFGVPDALCVDLAQQRDQARVNDWFHAQLRFDSRHPGLRVSLHAATLTAEPAPRFTVHGTGGSYIKWGLDPQEEVLKSGRRPRWADLQDWGQDLGESLRVTREPGPDGSQRVTRHVPLRPGNYPAWYANLRDALWGQADPMVDAQAVRGVMRLLALGERSARESRWVGTEAG